MMNLDVQLAQSMIAGAMVFFSLLADEEFVMDDEKHFSVISLIENQD